MRDNVCVFFSPAAMALGGVGFLWRGLVLFGDVDATVLGLVGGAPGGETPRVADSSAGASLAARKTLEKQEQKSPRPYLARHRLGSAPPRLPDP